MLNPGFACIQGLILCRPAKQNHYLQIIYRTVIAFTVRLKDCNKCYFQKSGWKLVLSTKT